MAQQIGGYPTSKYAISFVSNGSSISLFMSYFLPSTVLVVHFRTLIWSKPCSIMEKQEDVAYSSAVPIDEDIVNIEDTTLSLDVRLHLPLMDWESG